MPPRCFAGHSNGAAACFRVAFYAPAAFLEGEAPDGPLAFVRIGPDDWPAAIAPATLDDVRCGWCGALLGASDVSGQPTTMPIIALAERRRADRGTRLTRALLDATEHPSMMTARDIAELLKVDARVITAAMESGEIAHAFRVGRRGGRGEWRCWWENGRHYIKRLEARATDPAA